MAWRAGLFNVDDQLCRVGLRSPHLLVADIAVNPIDDGVGQGGDSRAYPAAVDVLHAEPGRRQSLES